MKIAFVWDWQNDPEQLFTWKDGLAAAIRLLSQRHEVAVWTCGQIKGDYIHQYFPIRMTFEGDVLAEEVKEWNPDVILVWGDMTRPSQAPLSKLKKPMACCFAGGATDGPNWYRFGHVFVENEEYRKKFEEQGASASIAFGTNTELYKPLEAPKSIDVYFPATFADWKRHDLFMKSVSGMRSMCVGYMYPVSERYCWEEPMKRGVTVAPHVSADVNRMLMGQSKCVLVTSKNVGGSQRTVLEALSMNTPVVVMSDNHKCCEYLESIGKNDWIVEPDPVKINEKIKSVTPVDTRSLITGKWDEKTYADRLEEGLKSIL